MTASYKDLRLWEEDWKRTPSVREFEQDYHGRLKEISPNEWVAERMEPAGDMEICGSGDSQQEAVHDWWENRLNALAPEDVSNDRMILMLRGAGDPRFQHVRIKGYDDED